MDGEKILKALQTNDFTKVINKSQKFVKGATIYAKEIRKNIFLLFVVEEDGFNKIHALIASFDRMESIGIKEPLQLMFYLLITKNEDVHYFGKYLKIT